MRGRAVWRSVPAFGRISAGPWFTPVGGVMAALVLIAALVLLMIAGPIGVVALLAMAAAAAILRWPALGVYGAISVAPLHVYRHAVGPVNLSLFRLIVILLVLALLLHMALKTSCVARQTSGISLLIAGGLVVVYLGAAAVQSERSVTDLGPTLLGQRAIFLGAMLVLAAGIVYLGLSLGSVMRLAVLSSLPIFSLALYQWIIGDPAQRLPFQELIEAPGSFDIYRSGGFAEEGVRPAATFSDPNFLGLYAAMVFILSDVNRAAGRRWLRVAGDLVSVLSALVILVAGSRSGVVVLLAYLLVIRLARARFPRRGKLAIAGVALVTALLFTLAPGPLEALGRGDPISSTREHVYTRASALGIGFAHPVLGIGLGNVGVLLGEPPDRSSAHALPFTVFAEEGTLGLLLIVLVLGFPWLVMVHKIATGSLVGLALGIFVAVWLYDFIFVLDVAAVWWGLALAAGSRVEGEVIAQRLKRVWAPSRRVGDRATVTPV